MRNGLKNRLLNGVGVLIFVHQNFAIAGCDLARGSGRFSGIAVGQEADGLVLEVGKVEQAALPPGLLKRLVKLLYQRKQAGKRAERSGKIAADGLGVAIERIQRITQQAERRFTQRRCALLRVQILRLADDRKAAKVRRGRSIDLIPSGHDRIGSDGFKIPLEERDVFFRERIVARGERDGIL